jgi:hypothetical protein
MERAREEKEAHGEIETAHPGYLGAQDTYYVGTIKSVGRISHRPSLTPTPRWLSPSSTTAKNALVAADMLNDRVLPFFEEQKVLLLCVLTDRGTEYCGQREHHEYPLYLAVDNIDQSRTRPGLRKPMGSVSASIEPSRKSSTPRRSARSCTRLSTNYRRISTTGSGSTI